MIKDLLKYSISNLWHRKLRSFLTILSIMIGITAIFALSSFGIGMQHFIEDTSKKMGTDKIMMMPKDYMTAFEKTQVSFSEEDLDFIKKTKGIDEATGMMFSSAKVKFKDFKEKYPYVIGMSTDSKEKGIVEDLFAGYGLEKGRAIKKGDVLNVVLGYNYLFPNKIFKKPVSVGDTIEINDVKVKVIGFYQEIGNPSDDSQVYLSLEGYKEIFQKDDYFFLLMRVAPGENPTKLAERISEKFRKYKGQEEGEEDFFIQTFEELMATYGAVMNILVVILVLIAMMSVFVAAVNIMNTMYTSILERTQEIGVMKSIGAKNNFILAMFMVESGILGLIGGLVGLGLGYTIAKMGGFVSAYYGLAMLQPTFPLWLTIGCLFFAFSVGAFSGLPASLQGSKLNPVDALRYE